jgi:hypothetical protein
MCQTSGYGNDSYEMSPAGVQLYLKCVLQFDSVFASMYVAAQQLIHQEQKCRSQPHTNLFTKVTQHPAACKLSLLMRQTAQIAYLCLAYYYVVWLRCR